MRLDGTPFMNGGVSSNPGLPLTGDASLTPRKVQLEERLRELMKKKSELSALMEELGRGGVAVEASWRGIFDDPRVQADPACEALVAAAEAASRAAQAAWDKAQEAQSADLKRRLRVAAELGSAAEALEGRARGMLEQVRANHLAQTVIARSSTTPAPAGLGRERRTSTRARFEAMVDFESDHNFFTGFSGDISEGGLFIATVNLLPIGSKIEVTFSIGSGPAVSVPATVRWVREVLDDVRVMPGIGVEFEALPEHVRKGINEFIGFRDALFMA